MPKINHALKDRLYVRPKMGVIRTQNRLKGELPIPPSKMIFTVCSTYLASSYLKWGKLGADSIVEILRKNNLALENFSSVLDWGCGVCRVFRFWKDVAGPEWHGTDYNPELIEWNKRNIPFGKFSVNPLGGPLDYPDGTFDFVYALSVFTHLDEALQQYWIKEIARIIKPGGHLLFSTHGEAYRYVLSEEQKAQYDAGKIVILRPEISGENNCSAHHPVQYVRHELAPPYFTVIDHQPEGAKGNPNQDYWLLKRSGQPKRQTS